VIILPTPDLTESCLTNLFHSF